MNTSLTTELKQMGEAARALHLQPLAEKLIRLSAHAKVLEREDKAVGFGSRARDVTAALEILYSLQDRLMSDLRDGTETVGRQGRSYLENINSTITQLGGML